MKKELTHQEKLLFKAKVARRSRLFRYIIIIILLALSLSSLYLGLDIPYLPYASLVLGGLGLILLVITEVTLYTHRLYVTTQAVTERIGILSRRIKTVDLEDITDIVVTQSVRQRMLGYGEVHINTPEDKKFDEIVVPCLARPMKVKKVIEEIMRKRLYFPSERDKVHKQYARTEEQNKHSHQGSHHRNKG